MCPRNALNPYRNDKNGDMSLERHQICGSLQLPFKSAGLSVLLGYCSSVVFALSHFLCSQVKPWLKQSSHVVANSCHICVCVCLLCYDVVIKKSAWASRGCLDGCFQTRFACVNCTDGSVCCPYDVF